MLLPGYKVLLHWRQTWRSLICVSAMVLLNACNPINPPSEEPSERPRVAALAHHGYIWQRQWQTTHAQLLAQSQADIQQLRLLALQYHVSAHGPVWFQTDLPLPLLAQDKRPIWLVVRLDGQLPQLPSTTLVARLTTILQQWQQAGVTIAAVEIDYDSARSQLASYQLWLKQLRQQLPSELPLAITALPDWLQSPDFQALQTEVDVLTMQLHSVLSPEQGLFDASLAKHWATQLAASSTIPFYLALPTYHSALIKLPQDDSQPKTRFVVESEVLQLHAGARQELWVDPRQLAALLNHLEQQRWPLLQGIAWFRLPLPTDERNLPYTTLQALIQQRPLRSDLEISVTGTAPVLELWASNVGLTPMSLPRVISLQRQGCLYAEAAAGSKLSSTNHGYQLQLDTAKTIGVGQRVLLAWFHCQQLQLADASV